MGKREGGKEGEGMKEGKGGKEGGMVRGYEAAYE